MLELAEFTSLHYVRATDVAARLGLAAALAALLGIDRELRNKPVGLRTFMLVSTGAAAFALLTMELVFSMAVDDKLQMDPSRVVQGIIEGIGFLGAGAIIQGQRTVRGVTTGASIWLVGAIGLACGFGFYIQAVMVTTLGVIVLTVLGAIERALLKRPPTREDEEMR
jgi:putative Mg2+ transporter-C (MgtC) family protein